MCSWQYDITTKVFCVEERPCLLEFLVILFFIHYSVKRTHKLGGKRSYVNLWWVIRQNPPNSAMVYFCLGFRITSESITYIPHLMTRFFHVSNGCTYSKARLKTSSIVLTLCIGRFLRCVWLVWNWYVYRASAYNAKGGVGRWCIQISVGWQSVYPGVHRVKLFVKSTPERGVFCRLPDFLLSPLFVYWKFYRSILFFSEPIILNSIF